MAGRARERRADESLLELEPRALQRLVRRELGCPRDGRRKFRCTNDTAWRNRNHERRQHVLQLTNVARPIIPRERANGALSEHGFAADALRRLPPETVGEQRNVLDTFPER